MKEDSYEVRCQMAEMHDRFQADLDSTMKKKHYVKACWLCYAIFEQRITRLIEKHIEQCPQKPREEKGYVGIGTKIKCLKKLTNSAYGPYAEFDPQLLTELEQWCRCRNRLIHDLVRLDRYKEYDKEFKELALEGKPLVERLYAEATKVREWYREEHSLSKFPEVKCKCRSRCICEGK